MALFETDSLIVSTKNGTIPDVPFLALKDLILGKKYHLSIAFVDPATAQRINTEHRNKTYIPNTLSFSLDDTSGEIIMCKSAIRAQYKSFAMSYKKYIAFLAIHSMLHLKGYDHGDEMEEKEQLYLKKYDKLHSNEATITSRY